MSETETTVQVYRVYIKAPATAIWDAITTPEWTARYGHRGLSEYDLRPGGAYLGRANQGMVAQGAPEVAVDGEVIEVDLPRKLVQTFRMLMDPSIAAEGFTRLTYEIAEGRDGGAGAGTRARREASLAAPVRARSVSGPAEPGPVYALAVRRAA